VPSEATLETLNEKRLIKACLKGKEKARKAMYDAHKGVMFALCLRYASSREEAEDILQEGFLKVYRDLYQYKPEAPLGAWIRKVMVNTALEHIRKKNRRPQSHSREVEAWDSITHTTPSTEMNAKDLTAVIQSLPEEFRLVFNLVALEGYSHREVAEKLQISESNSKVRLNRARGMLQEKIALIFEIDR
jgi:RNA polymerase sigma-70 factor (ECF subfamily)